MLENYRSSMLQYQEASRLGLLPSLPYTDLLKRNASLISLGRTINASIKPGSARVSFDRRMEWFYTALSMYQFDTVLTAKVWPKSTSKYLKHAQHISGNHES
ncbi:hypothetical protein HaLaN_09747 [Haematococcus lacustris]|uniref:Uncharacterized protein n=1 Tax=Haematococcus lacustris TaxID=44745 RepID=A0A699YU87_HAELA|nr:hypothetical protein HaLaN_09747 [Haematococcus lacustris]